MSEDDRQSLLPDQRRPARAARLASELFGSKAPAGKPRAANGARGTDGRALPGRGRL